MSNQKTETPVLSGLVEISNEAYHANKTHVSRSGLKEIGRSPAHFYEKYRNPNRPQEKQTPALIMGTAVHCAVLEPEDFKNRYVCFNDSAKVAEIGGASPRATKAYKDFKNEFYAANPGKVILSLEDFTTCENVRDAVWAHPLASQLLQKGKAEQTFFYTCPETGAPLKIRIDFISELDGLIYIIDLKTTENASPASFGRSAVNYDYITQPPMYCDGFETATSIRPEGFVFIAVEKEPPYAVAVYYVPAEAMEIGRKQYLGQAAEFVACEAANYWPAYGDGAHFLKLPNYFYNS